MNKIEQLIEKREKDIREVQNSKCPIDMPLGETLWKTIREAQIKTLEMCIKDISLKQTAVASECKHECDKYVDADGVHCERCTELIERHIADDTTEGIKYEGNYKKSIGIVD